MYWVVVGGTYVILWWMALFILLPIGLHNEDDPPGQFVLGAAPKQPSAAAPRPRLFLKKSAGATVIATVVWGIFYALVLAGAIQL